MRRTPGAIHQAVTIHTACAHEEVLELSAFRPRTFQRC
jgi:hypothetical protein